VNKQLLEKAKIKASRAHRYSPSSEGYLPLAAKTPVESLLTFTPGTC
jgi:hypothetical protein